jgi:hypothetical protein
VAVAVAALGFSRLDDNSPSSRAGSDVPTGTVTPRTAASMETASMEALLRSQADALSARDRADYLADWDHDATGRQEAGLAYANLVSLGVTRIVPRLSLPSLREHDSTWTARVDVSWGLDGRDASPATSAVRYAFATRGERMVISGLSRWPGSHEPIWLVPGLEVLRGPRTLVAAASPAAAERVERLLRQAVTAVDQVLPAWRGGLVAYAPASLRDFAALIAARPGQYHQIAAVTTTVDGSDEAGAPTAIVVNPGVFNSLGPVGTHVVITHEATHVATDATAVSMPLWVAEGFADYVAIGSVRLPVAVAAKEALAVVRRSGAPQSLPADAAFDVQGNGLEATYEEAWMANALIARTYGQRRLVAFYQAVESRPDDLGGAFQRILHTSVPAFTASWRRYLRETAGAG